MIVSHLTRTHIRWHLSARLNGAIEVPLRPYNANTHSFLLTHIVKKVIYLYRVVVLNDNRRGQHEWHGGTLVGKTLSAHILVTVCLVGQSSSIVCCKTRNGVQLQQKWQQRNHARAVCVHGRVSSIAVTTHINEKHTHRLIEGEKSTSIQYCRTHAFWMRHYALFIQCMHGCTNACCVVMRAFEPVSLCAAVHIPADRIWLQALCTTAPKLLQSLHPLLGVIDDAVLRLRFSMTWLCNFTHARCVHATFNVHSCIAHDNDDILSTRRWISYTYTNRMTVRRA